MFLPSLFISTDVASYIENPWAHKKEVNSFGSQKTGVMLN